MPTPGDPIPRLLVSDFDFAPRDAERLRAALGADHVLLVKGRDAMRETLTTHPEADVLAGFFPPADVLDRAPNLRWIALASAGADHVLDAGLVRADGPAVTTANGVHAVPISEFVFSMMLLWARHWPEMLALQRAHDWPEQRRKRALTGRELFGATLAVVGVGAIGRRVAQLGRAFGMRVTGTTRSARPGTHDPDLDDLVPLARLDALLAEADYVVIAVPATPQTHHLIGAQQLRAMKPSAFLVNIARGSVVDEQALIAALQAGRIAGAGLDVVEDEPLAAESPLWNMPNVIISPHVSGVTPSYSARFTDLLLENLARFQAGEPLRNLVSIEHGY
jgi:phosphoglycerate dehydrogenase-like enzyme